MHVANLKPCVSAGPLEILAVVAALISSEVSEAAAGRFTLDDKTYEFGEVSAFRIRDNSTGKMTDTLVLITGSVPDSAAIIAADDPYSAAINDPATRGDFLAFTVSEDGEVGVNAHIDGVQYLDTSGEIFDEPGSLEAECETNSATHVKCEVTTPKSVKTAGGAIWTLSASFDSDVLARPAGKQVAAGGGEPGAALRALQEALRGDDLGKILELMDPDKAETYRADWRSEEENLAEAKDFIGRMLPLDGKVMGGEYLNDDKVDLEVHGTKADWGEDLLRYSVIMVRSDGRWRYHFSKFVGFVE